MALSRRVPRFLLRAGLVGISVYYAVWGGEYSAFDLRKLEAMQAEEHAELARVREQVDSLRAQSERLEKDPAAIERIARERFGMIRDGELLYRFVHVDPARRDPAKIAAAP